MNKEYPSHHSSTALMSTMGAIQAIVFAICVDRDLTQWKLGYNIRLLMVAYSGIVASGITTIVIAWCIKMRGPLFASVFYPLQLLLVFVAANLLIDEKLYLGRYILNLTKLYQIFLTYLIITKFILKFFAYY
ncbi:hypothetical protein MtrunA17_Chr4g0050921 [Medicago truncatula]|uniref:WAT1-related protein n=1 Tax=Medicago truncatula TaxID=3880 RepID=A0A396ID87_MEDTR|nr:hypothetical protein MtrunA17_Chr4g0050921 [Medicago truncatula]